MYGVFFYIIVGITRIGAKIILFLQDIFRRKEAKENNKEVYTDHNGASRLTSTGQRFTASQKSNGHWVWTDDNFNVIKDISQNHIEQCRKDSYDFSAKHGCSTYVWMESNWGKATAGSGKKIYENDYAKYFKNNKIASYNRPTLYKDMNNGNIYAVGILRSDWKQILQKNFNYNRNIGLGLNNEYFINPKTNEIIRPIDKDSMIGDKCLNLEEINMINKLIRENNQNFFLKYGNGTIYNEGRNKKYARP